MMLRQIHSFHPWTHLPLSISRQPRHIHIALSMRASWRSNRYQNNGRTRWDSLLITLPEVVVIISTLRCVYKGQQLTGRARWANQTRCTVVAMGARVGGVESCKTKLLVKVFQGANRATGRQLKPLRRIFPYTIAPVIYPTGVLRKWFGYLATTCTTLWHLIIQ